jgi:hypothetical protein
LTDLKWAIRISVREKRRMALGPAIKLRTGRNGWMASGGKSAMSCTLG